MSDLWTIQRILDWTQGFFRDKGIDSARLDAEVLLADLLGQTRVYLYTHFDKPLSPEEREEYRARVKRRAAREPVAQILGKREFFGLDLRVNREVMAPRPETEHLVDLVLDWVRGQQMQEPRIVDIGTGTGAIAIALASELSEARLVATDLSEAALAVAEQNVLQHGLTERISLVAGDLFAPVEGQFDVVVSNPPYIDPEIRAELAPEVREWEPEVALFAEHGGLATIRRLCEEAPARLQQPGLLAFEIGAEQGPAVTALLQRVGGWAEVAVRQDLQGLDRVVSASR